MDLRSERIVITGAAGGIGTELTRQLAARGARLCLLVRRPESLDDLAIVDGSPLALACDVTQTDQRQMAVETLRRRWGGADVLINLAGVMDFRRFDEQDPEAIARIVDVNLRGPLLLTRALLPGMIDRGHGRIVNVGSMFGSIGFPCFAAYSATKFALRGYSQALRRELAGTGVGVSYVSPRAVKTAFNPPVVHEMASRGIMRMDEPARVAQAIVRAIEKGRKEVYVGFPESLFARINAVLPGLVDRGLAKQTPVLSSYAAAKAEG